MRVAIVTESFLPQVNGVTNSVLRLCEQLVRRGHEAIIIAPEAGASDWARVPVVRVPSVPVPGYGAHRVAWPWPWLPGVLSDFAPDLVHVASPAVLGAQAVLTAERLDLPCIAVYQTDLAAYARLYRMGSSRAVWRWLGWVHGHAGMTLAPSHHAVAALRDRGVPRVYRWPRGVDLDRFHPRHRDDALRRSLAGGGGPLVGYVGRLAAEKQIHLLADLDRAPDARLVIVGDGPARATLERELPRAVFLGLRHGAALARVYASLDVFVHTGPHETFCQAAQEALASGVPVVAPAAGGLPDLVRDGVNGRLFTPGSARALTDAVGDVLTGPPGPGRMALAARDSVAGRSWGAVVDAYLAHADHLLRPAASRPTLRSA